jgi:Domain of unknown function (DUF4214)
MPMQRLANPSRRESSTSLRKARLALEELESRHLPSAASLAVAGDIIRSLENFQNFISNQYMTFLHRPPDATGLAGWVNGLEHGLAPEQVEAGIAASPEDMALHGGTQTNWVNGLYQDFLNRAADTAGLNAWLGALSAGVPAYDVAHAFATSPEREALLITNDYQHFLGRAPEAGAIASWQTQFQSGLNEFSLETHIAGSDEFYLHSGNTDQSFITSAYETILGRTPSTDEVNSWLTVMTDVATTGGATSSSPLITLNLNPLDIKLLGLEVQTNQIQVRVAAQPGQGQLLGNLLTDVANLLNLQGVNNALNTVLGSVVTLLNSVSLNVSGVNTISGSLSTAPVATTPVLDAFVAPVHLNLLGALVDTSPIHVTLMAHSGPGLVLGNVVTDLANIFNPPLPSQLNLDTINAALVNLLNELGVQAPGIGSSGTTTPPTTPGTEQVVSLTVPPINLNLLGLVLKTSQIQVNANAQTGNGELLGNVLTTLLNTLGATPQNLSALSANLNALLGKVVGILNAASLLLPSNALSSLSQVLQTLALPNLVNATGTASAPILNLSIASSDGTTPPVNVNLLGLVVTTSNIQAQLLAQTGDGQILGNLLYNVANLLNPGGSLNLLTILNQLGL